MFEKLICLAIGYVFGLFQTSYIYGKSKGIDIREHGSGNAGSTNALRTLGAKAGAITLAGDCFKCVFAVLAVTVLFGKSQEQILPLLKLYAGAGCILGHNFPFYLNFKGGKGIASSVGMLLAFDIRIFAVAAVIFFAVYFLTHFVSLCSLAAYLSFFICVIIWGQNGSYGMDAGALMELYVLAGLLMVLAYWRHRKNIVRLVNGNENKTYLKKKR